MSVPLQRPREIKEAAAMGLLSTIVAAGAGYVAGAMTGRQSMERLPERFRQAAASRRGSGSPGTTMDVREIRDVMTASPETVAVTQTLQDAARVMKTKAIGDVLVLDEQGSFAGIVTDRDIVIRGTADGADPATAKVEDVYTREVTVLAPTDTVHDAVTLMRARDVRRLPVVEGGRAIGIVSLGDIAVETTPSSLLADISTAPPDR